MLDQREGGRGRGREEGERREGEGRRGREEGGRRKELPHWSAWLWLAGWLGGLVGIVAMYALCFTPF